MNPAPLTADLIARAIIASAVSRGELPPVGSQQMTVGSTYPAAVGVALEAKHPLPVICRILRIEPSAVVRARSADPASFSRAQSAAREAVRYYLSAHPAAPEPEPPPPRPRRSAPLRKAETRAMPRGARLQNLGEGVQRIVVQPVPASVARHAKQQLDRGADLAFVADCFGFDPEALQRAVEALNEGEAA